MMERTNPRKLNEALKCQTCKKEVLFFKDGKFKCPHCAITITPIELLKNLLWYWELEWSRQKCGVRFMCSYYSETAFEEFNFIKASQIL